MKSSFVLTGFSDEIYTDFDKQLTHLKKLGMAYFEIRGVDGKNISELTDEEILTVKSKMDAAGIKVSSIGSPIGKIKITDDFEPHLSLLGKIIRTAKTLGTKYIRIFSFFIPEGEKAETYRDEVMRRIKAMAEMAEQEGVILLHENEKAIYGDIAGRCLDILKTVNSPALRAVFDPANFTQCDQPVYPEAYELLCDYVEYIHIKDSLADKSIVPAGMGISNVYEVLSAVYKKGYSGFLSLEPHLGNFVGLANLEHGNKVADSGESGPDKFDLAYNSLIKIVERVVSENG